MSQSKKTLTLGKIKQLVDLNGDSTNFDVSFKVTCHDDTPYNLLVVDQTTLDNIPELKYKEASKTISGNIVADKNVYQNYFLILKSARPCIVDVELTKKVLPKTPTGPVDSVGSPIVPSRGPGTANQRRTVVSQSNPINRKKIGLIALVVIIGFGILWWLYKRKGSDDKDGKEPSLSSEHKYKQSFVNMSPAASSHGITPSYSSKQASPAASSTGDHRGYRPTRSYNAFKGSSVSPDVMSQVSHQSSATGGNSLLHRLRKFAR
jgi:hypothetical protein